jgi:hypothetical protein
MLTSLVRLPKLLCEISRPFVDGAPDSRQPLAASRTISDNKDLVCPKDSRGSNMQAQRLQEIPGWHNYRSMAVWIPRQKAVESIELPAESERKRAGMFNTRSSDGIEHRMIGRKICR